MIDTILAADRQLAKSWREEATRRRRFSNIDPVADALEHCAAELEELARENATAAAYLTAEEYAKIHDVTSATVCRWIKRGELTAIATGKGYRISRFAKRERVKRSA